ncbi:protein O-linked-mannose beta-1,2-N-acetylglucosaminyltransferase 1-like [Portunus trituberculatus]|uniref:protein O-linked-mannose beta-1,2-N-acetylglucosaminyltransferase 1-like n=1 Tax=Portunus trituberculatus TaxID=210409 RepID=UPI001E1D1DAB|nr:protein O-linked-mannose beta-1,2-N-acetylglucosaminyltransferase 1-like [Portunus trituberculatus]
MKALVSWWRCLMVLVVVVVLVVKVQGSLHSALKTYIESQATDEGSARRREVSRSPKQVLEGRKETDVGFRTQRRKLLGNQVENEMKGQEILVEDWKTTGHGQNKMEGTPDAPWVELSGAVDHTGVTVWLQGREVYKRRNILREWAGEQRRYHAGVHIIALHQSSGKMMQTRQFLTWQPTAHRMLAEALRALQEGRLVLVLGAPDYLSWLNVEGTKALKNLGALQGLKAVKEEAWVFLARKGHGALFETLITARNYTSKIVSPLTFSVSLPRYPERHCPWYQNTKFAAQMEFCETYEGYGEMCDCQRPVHLNRTASPHLSMEEVIPVALITASRFPKVAQQVRTLWENPGGSQTPLVMLVDGAHHEAEALGRLLNITVVTHNNTATQGTKERVNKHVKFSIQTMFDTFPDVDKVIFVEDDLVLSNDFISYFQQTSVLLSVDQSILCVNAYNYNAFPHTASDPHRIYRVQSYPYYGWMTRRPTAARMLSHWPPPHKEADWDLYIRYKLMTDQTSVIIPEVPRTKHEGGAGVHVSGLEQESTYSKRPLNTVPQPTLNLRRHWDPAYSVDLMAKILQGKVVHVTTHPCIASPVPKYQSNITHIIYISLAGDGGNTDSFTVLGKCLGFYYNGLFENYRSTFSLKYFETPLILVSCYSSVYCVDVPRSLVFAPSKAALEFATVHSWRHTNELAVEMWRIPPRSLLEEVTLDNVAGFEVMLKV